MSILSPKHNISPAFLLRRIKVGKNLPGLLQTIDTPCVLCKSFTVNLLTRLH